MVKNIHFKDISSDTIDCIVSDYFPSVGERILYRGKEYIVREQQVEILTDGNCIMHFYTTHE